MYQFICISGSSLLSSRSFTSFWYIIMAILNTTGGVIDFVWVLMKFLLAKWITCLSNFGQTPFKSPTFLETYPYVFLPQLFLIDTTRCLQYWSRATCLVSFFLKVEIFLLFHSSFFRLHVISFHVLGLHGSTSNRIAEYFSMCQIVFYY